MCILGPNLILDAAVYAAHHNMTLNASKVGRGPKNFLQIDTDLFNTGVINNDTVYVIELSNVNYLSPLILSSEYSIYLCDQLICITHQDLFIKDPDDNSVEIPPEVFSALIESVIDINGFPEPISTYEDL